MHKTPEILAFWSGPRNVSTALMYSFAQRRDCMVLDEPLFGYFLKHTGVWRPSRDEALAIMNTDAPEILAGIQKPSDKPLLMVKNIANHIEGLPLEELLNYKNVILTRHPAKVLSSYTKQVAQPTPLDLGYVHQLKILRFLQEQKQPVWVVDSDQVIENSRTTLEQLCRALQIPFEENMLHWEAGPRPEDGIWAKYWYHSVHQSTGFALPDPNKTYEVPERLQELYEDSLNLYQKIKSYEQIQST